MLSRPQAICEVAGVDNVNLNDTGRCEIVGPNKAAAEQALEYVKLLASDPEPGSIFRKRKVASLQVSSGGGDLSSYQNTAAWLGEPMLCNNPHICYTCGVLAETTVFCCFNSLVLLLLL